MKAIRLFLVSLVFPFVAIAGSFASTYRLDGGVVAVTNTQENSSWATVAVLVKFDAGTNGTLAVRRVVTCRRWRRPTSANGP